MPDSATRQPAGLHPVQLDLLPQTWIAMGAVRADWTFAHLVRTLCADAADGLYQPWWQAPRDARRRRPLDRSGWTTRNTKGNRVRAPRYLRLELTADEVDALLRVRPEWQLARIVRHLIDDLCVGAYEPEWATGVSPYASHAAR